MILRGGLFNWNDWRRYTIHPETRKEVLKKLLELNHKIYEEEIRQGLHKESGVRKFYADKGKDVPGEVVARTAEQVKKLKGFKDKNQDPKPNDPTLF